MKKNSIKTFNFGHFNHLYIRVLWKKISMTHIIVINSAEEWIWDLDHATKIFFENKQVHIKCFLVFNLLFKHFIQKTHLLKACFFQVSHLYELEAKLNHNIVSLFRSGEKFQKYYFSLPKSHSVLTHILTIYMSLNV